jgi:erythromycin esterase
LILIMSAGMQLRAQLIKSHVISSTAQVSSVNNADTNFADLEIIGSSIGNADVVMLGEQDHGDAPTFAAKARLIRYLHEKKGFNVVAFEADFFSLESSRRTLSHDSASMRSIARGNIFSIWTACPEASPAFEYLANSGSQIALTGFDNQLHGSYRSTNYRRDMESMLKKAKSKRTNQLSRLFQVIEKVYPLDGRVVLGIDSLRYFDSLVALTQKELPKLVDSSFLSISLKNLHAYIKQTIAFNLDDFDQITIRDKQMADNLLWLRKYRFPGQKIIVWAHNYHVLKNGFSAFSGRYGRHISMGTNLDSVLRDSMYVVGFTSLQGKAGRLGMNIFNVPAPKSESIESWISPKGYNYAFVDFKSFRKANPTTEETFFMKGKYHENAAAIWTKVFDGVFYIKEMFACTR